MSKNILEQIKNGDERIWFISFCNDNEIDRIISPQNAFDYLLQQRANIVADNTRYLRVYMRKANLYKDWSFEKSFIDTHYLKVLECLSKDDKEFCKDIAYGDIFSSDANGYAERHSQWGRIIYLNESLRFFMKFCNLALFDFDEVVPNNVRLNALRIAIRVMMKQESMDFFMDPRGVVPEKIGIKIHEPIPYELQYIAGHEFAHHICQHLNDDNVSNRNMLSIGENEYYKPVYTVSQTHEFEADISSLTRPKYSIKEYCNVLEGALIWLLSLELSETAMEIVNPMSHLSIKTHPSAKERFENLLSNVSIPSDFNMKKIEKLKENTIRLKNWIEQDFAYNYDIYDFYGSIYLDAPNTKWRGKELIDRVDY